MFKKGDKVKASEQAYKYHLEDLGFSIDYVYTIKCNDDGWLTFEGIDDDDIGCGIRHYCFFLVNNRKERIQSLFKE